MILPHEVARRIELKLSSIGIRLDPAALQIITGELAQAIGMAALEGQREGLLKFTGLNFRDALRNGGNGQ